MRNDTGNYQRFWYSVFAGVVSLAVNLYHFVYAIRDGTAFFPLSNLYKYEAPIGVLLIAACYVFIFAGSFWTGMVVYTVYETAKSTIANRNK